jgi:hypothetical protein
MYILSKESKGQMGGLLEISDLKVGSEYIILDALYKEKGFLKIDEYRVKHWSMLLVSDKWGNRPRSFEYAPGLYDNNQGDLIGNVTLTPGHVIIFIERQTDNKQDPLVTILEVTDLHQDIDVVVKERFRYREYERVINDHQFSYVIKLGRRLIDEAVIDPNLKSLYRTMEKVGS